MTDAPARLSPPDWIRAGFAALLAEGPAGIRVEAIARELGATKGSFYWHFKDVAALRAAMLAAWEAAAEAADRDLLEAPGVLPRRRVMALVDRLTAEDEAAAQEAAVRAWARTDAEAAAALARLDARRLEALRAALAGAGLGAAAAARGAVAILAAGVGLASLRAAPGVAPRRDLAALARAVLDGRV